MAMLPLPPGAHGERQVEAVWVGGALGDCSFWLHEALGEAAWPSRRLPDPRSPYSLCGRGRVLEGVPEREKLPKSRWSPSRIAPLRLGVLPRFERVGAAKCRRLCVGDETWEFKGKSFKPPIVLTCSVYSAAVCWLRHCTIKPRERGCRSGPGGACFAFRGV